MKTINLGFICGVVFVVALTSCNSTTDPDPLPKQVPATRDLVPETVLVDTLDPGDSQLWKASLIQGSSYVVAITALTDNIGLESYGDDSTFTHRVGYLTNPSNTSLPKDIINASGQELWYLKVDGSEIASTKASYCIVLLPMPAYVNTPAPETTSVVAGVPYWGQVETRSRSLYEVHGMSQESHRVTLFALTGDIDLYAEGCPLPRSNYEVNALAVECSAGDDSTTTIVVDSGPLTRYGGTYYLLVR